MKRHALSVLQTDVKTEKRAQFEAFEFDVDPDRHVVTVRNASHEDPGEHEYEVVLKEGVPAACECPSCKYHDGACKHMTAVAIREPVMEAGRSRRISTPISDAPIRMDGGIEIVVGDDEGVILGEDTDPASDGADLATSGDGDSDDSDGSTLGWDAAADDRPDPCLCWPCYHAGFELPNLNANRDGLRAAE
jgi:hypothetical protein